MNKSLGTDIADWLRAHEQEMIALLEKVVNIDSGSNDKAGVDRVGAVFREQLERAGIATESPLQNSNPRQFRLLSRSDRAPLAQELPQPPQQRRQ